MKIICIPLMIIASVAPVNPSTEAVFARESNYQIKSHGFQVGEMKTTFQPLIRDGRRMVRFRSTTAIDAKFLFFSKQSIGRDEALVGENGPIEYRHTQQEKGGSREVDAIFSDAQVMFEIKEGGKSRTVVIHRDRYDFTSMDCAEMSLDRQGEWKELRLLDLENARILTRKYVWRKSEDISIGGKNIRCRVIDFEDQENSCRRWITKDEKGILIARQEGKGKSGSYVLKLTSLIEG